MIGDASVETDLVVRPYREDDEEEVLALLRLCLGGGPAGERSPEFFRWKHEANPFGRSFMLVAEDAGRIVGLRAFLRWRFRVGDRTIDAVRPVDTATHPDHRGRGVFSTLTRAALDAVRADTDLVFNTPNPDSLRGYLKMGWQVVGEVPIRVWVRRPARFVAARLRRSRSADRARSDRPAVSAPFAAEVLEDEGLVAALIDGSEVPGWGYSTERSVAYLRWRYGDAPLLGYHAAVEERDGTLAGVAFFRPRLEGQLWGFSVSEMLVAPGDVGTAKRLLARVRRAGDVAYDATSFPDGTAAAAASRGPRSLRSPRNPTLVVNPLRPNLAPDPHELSSWALSACDVEVF